MQSLATFHSAVHSFGERGASVAPAPAVRRRAERLRALKTGQLDRIVHHCRAHSDSPLARHAQLFVDGFQTASAGLTEALASACGHTVPILPCIRDTWYDHVLFAGEQVSGIVDFDALRDDTAAGDIARLLGSLVGDDRGRWLAGIEAYQTVRPLTAAETTLCRVLDRANVAMAGLSWLEWIFVDHRQFDDWGEVLKRLDCLATRVKCSRLPSEYLPEPPAPSSGERTG
jgi:Ser/Thr protein kinase RdoA (MazF antagonist)